ncbi:MAG: hypothetical protein EOP86_08005 [Verrucomicrobiaceae bacterium]|nr:MAG: hypothetical protein EOP86_08005 [Verrucomicrobiaceae bacterium]
MQRFPQAEVGAVRTSPPARPVHTETHATSDPLPARPVAPAAKVNVEPALAALKGNVVVNLGKVEDIGRKAAELMLTQGELAGLRSIDQGLRTPEQKGRLLELERQRAATLGTLEEIEGFQDNPDEYSRFFSSLLSKAANLDEARTNSVAEYMRGRSEVMVAGRLSAANKPADPQQQEDWEERRDAFNEETVEGAAKLLPPGEAERVGFTSKFLELLERDFDKAE